MVSQCPGRNRDGSPCSAVPLAGQAWCHWHDPEREQLRAETRAEGGRNRSREARAKKLLATGMATLGDVNDVLKLALLETWKGKLDPKVANAMANLAGKIKDLSVGVELEERIDEAQRQTGEIAGRIGA
jgi:hypothetical protein